MRKIGIRILANAGYGTDQVNGITLEELKDFVNDLIAEYGEDTEIVTVDDGNHYGAKYGKLYTEIVADEDDEDEDGEFLDFCEEEDPDGDLPDELLEQVYNDIK